MKTNRLMALGGAGLVAAMVVGGAMVFGAGNATAAPAAAPAPAPAPAEGKTFAIDSVHTNVLFKVKHLQTSNFYGRFNKVTGSFTLGDTAGVDVTVDAGSADTNNSKRDTHVKSPDFLSAAEFPNITFKATGLAKSGDGAWKGKGDLTFRGVTKSIDVEIKQTGGGKGMDGKEIAGVESSITIKRSEFGSKGLVGPVSDEVTLWFASEGGVK